LLEKFNPGDPVAFMRGVIRASLELYENYEYYSVAETLKSIRSKIDDGKMPSLTMILSLSANLINDLLGSEHHAKHGRYEHRYPIVLDDRFETRGLTE